VGYLNESNYLGETPQAQMELPSQLADALVAAEQSTEMITLPGGIVMKKQTAVLLALVALGLALWYMNHRKKG
jgi:hypothetical protein